MTNLLSNVLIVGGGVSGLLTARFLSARGIEVVIIDQRMQPGRNNTFHGVISADDLQNCGLTAAQFEGHLEPLVGSGVEQYSIVHNNLLDALREGLDVTIASDVRLLREGADICGAVVDGAEHRALVTVLADHADPRLAEEPGIRPDWPPTQLMHLGKRRYRNAEALQSQMIWSGTSSWGQSGWAILIPYQNELTLVCAMVLEDEMVSARHILELADDLVSRGNVFPIGLDQKRLDEFTEVVPIGGFANATNPASDGVVLVGDALGRTNPLTRDGISTSLPVTQMAAETIAKAVATGDASGLVLGEFGEALERVAGQNRSLHRWMEADAYRGMRWQIVTNTPTSATLSKRWSNRLAGLLGKRG